MAKSKRVSESDLATLALASAIAAGSRTGVDDALNAGADANAYWIDGKTNLRRLAKLLGPDSISKAIEKAFSPEAIKRVPSMREDRKWWSDGFLSFLIMRGYDFEGETITLSKLGGSPIRKLLTAKSVFRMVQNVDRKIEDASVGSGGSDCSTCRITFAPKWNGDRRITGFSLMFLVDALDWDLWEMFRTAVKKAPGVRVVVAFS